MLWSRLLFKLLFRDWTVKTKSTISARATVIKWKLYKFLDGRQWIISSGKVQQTAIGHRPDGFSMLRQPKKKRKKGRKKVDNIKNKIIIYAHLSTCLVIAHISQSAYKLPTKRKSGAQSRPISHHSLSPALNRKVVSFVIWLRLCVFLCTELFGTKNSRSNTHDYINVVHFSWFFVAIDGEILSRFHPSRRRHPCNSWYVTQLNPGQRRWVHFIRCTV